MQILTSVSDPQHMKRGKSRSRRLWFATTAFSFGVDSANCNLAIRVDGAFDLETSAKVPEGLEKADRLLKVFYSSRGAHSGVKLQG